MRALRLPALLAACAMLAACNQGSAPEQQSGQQAQSQAQTSAAAENVPTARLPKDVQPLDYTLDFTMDPDKPGYSAHEEIHVKLSQPRDVIWMHGQAMNVKNPKLVLADGSSLDIKYEQVNEDGVVKLSLPQEVQPQEARIVLDFDTDYFSGLHGAYKVSEDGENYVFTQFEAIAARRAFPCFDEPAFKTPYTYSFTVPEGDKVVANTPVASKDKTDNGMVTWHFATTKPLPSYLVAWAVGPLDIVEGPTIPANDVRDEPVPLYGVTVKGKGDQIAYVLKHTGEIVQAEEKYFGIRFPYKKLAMIAVPDFAAGAMENPGAITFREEYLLMDPDHAPEWQTRAFWSVAAHELAHQWFGDLVTMPWWNDIWLNEAFATWTAQKMMETMKPEWHPEMRGINSTQGAMHEDSLATARQIRQPIEDTGDIETAFDGITYEKGSAVIGMFEHYVGEEAFRKGIHYHLEQFKFGNADVNDFLASISKMAGEDIGPAFRTFLNQPGLPLVEMAMHCDNGKASVHLKQSRYLPLGSTGSTDKQWQIPVCMKYPAGDSTSTQCEMLEQPEADVSLKAGSCPAWIMPNADAKGYYQWSLSGEGYSSLLAQSDALQPVEMMSVAGSVGAAFRAGKIDTAEAMKALKPLADSDSHEVAKEPMGLVGFARTRLVNEDTKPKVEAFARKLYSKYDVAKDFSKGGAPSDSNQRLFEASVANFLADTGRDPKVRKAAVDGAKRLLGLNDSGKPDFGAMSSDFIPTALTIAVQDAGAPVFNVLDQMFQHAQQPFIRVIALRAMSSATDPKLSDKVRSMALDQKALKRNEIMTVLFGQMSQPETRDATWSWLKANYDQLVKIMPPDHARRLPMAARFFCSDAKADEVESFFNEDRIKELPGAKRALAQAVESARLCAAERKAQSDSAQKYFSSF